MHIEERNNKKRLNNVHELRLGIIYALKFKLYLKFSTTKHILEKKNIFLFMFKLIYQCQFSCYFAESIVSTVRRGESVQPARVI